jgi:AsmA protein
MRALKILVALIVALVAVVAIFIWVGIPSDYLVEKIRTEFKAQTGREVEIAGGAKLVELWPTLSVEVRDITVVPNSDEAAQVKVASARAEIEASSIFSGKPKITGFKIVHPVLQVPLVRRAKPAAAAKSRDAGAPKKLEIPAIGNIAVEDATVQFMRSKDKVESHLDHINVTAKITEPDHLLQAAGSAKAGSQDVRFEVKSKASIDKIDQSLPVEMALELPGLLDGKLASTANVTTNGSLVKINDLEGTIDQKRFTGFASIDLASKPKIKLDLDFKHLSFGATSPSSTAKATPGEPWSDEKIDLDSLNFIDTQVAFSAAELNIGTLRLAPVYVEAALVNGVLNLAASNTGVYGGKGDGLLTLDVSRDVQRQTVQLNLSGVHALPLLSSLANFRELDGTMQGRFDVRSSGASARAIVSSLAGTMDLHFRDGTILDVNIADMVHTLTHSTLTGWQENSSQKTDIQELSALFKVNAGRATTDNLKLVGPAVRIDGKGTADLPAKKLQFTLNTQLVLNPEGKSGTGNPVSFGVPVIVEGKWDSPQIYPDMNGILDNPDAAYAKLHQLGVGLFGKSSTGTDFLKGIGTFFDNKGTAPDDKGGTTKDTDTPAVPADKPNAQAPAQPAAPKEAAKDSTKDDSKDTKDTKDDDDKFDDKKTRDKIESILKDFFGK